MLKKPPFHKSLYCSVKGLWWMLKSERNFQIELLAVLMNWALIVYFKLSLIDTALILGVCFLVLIAETINTAIEKLCDFVEPNHNQKIGLIKDIAAASVWIASLLALIIGALVYSKYIFGN